MELTWRKGGARMRAYIRKVQKQSSRPKGFNKPVRYEL
jgi:hypothetical protein